MLLLGMQVTLEIPDEMADWVASHDQNLSRAALEALAIEGYRSDTLTYSRGSMDKSSSQAQSYEI